MIQFNLLPDVKASYVKAKRTMHMVTLISVLASGVAVAVLLLMFMSVHVVQRQYIKNLDNQIADNKRKIISTPNLDKMLTVQNQLNTLPGLDDQKIIASRLFGYLAQITPSNVTISKLDVAFAQAVTGSAAGANSMIVTGDAPSLDAVNVFTDTLKNAKYTTDASGSQAAKAFDKVVLSTINRTSKGANYTITFSFVPDLFSNTHNATLTVPSGTAGAQPQLFQEESQ